MTTDKEPGKNPVTTYRESGEDPMEGYLRHCAEETRRILEQFGLPTNPDELIDRRFSFAVQSGTSIHIHTVPISGIVEVDRPLCEKASCGWPNACLGHCVLLSVPEQLIARTNQFDLKMLGLIFRADHSMEIAFDRSIEPGMDGLYNLYVKSCTATRFRLI